MYTSHLFIFSLLIKQFFIMNRLVLKNFRITVKVRAIILKNYLKLLLPLRLFQFFIILPHVPIINNVKRFKFSLDSLNKIR